MFVSNLLAANLFIENYPIHLVFNFWRVDCTGGAN